jgi:hypothetical protein
MSIFTKNTKFPCLVSTIRYFQKVTNSKSGEAVERIRIYDFHEKTRKMAIATASTVFYKKKTPKIYSR